MITSLTRSLIVVPTAAALSWAAIIEPTATSTGTVVVAEAATVGLTTVGTIERRIDPVSAATEKEGVSGQLVTDQTSLSQANPTAFLAVASVSAVAFTVSLASAFGTFIPSIASLAGDVGLLAMIVATGMGSLAAKMAQQTI